VGWLWFLGTLVPMIGLIQVGAQARADRYMYIPMIGILIMVAWTFRDLAQRWPKAAMAAVAVSVCALAAQASAQIQVWRNSETLFAHAAAVTSGNYVAEHNLGVAIADDPKRLPEAILHYRAALAIQPESVEALTDLGTALANTGQLREAAAEYQHALRLAPDSAIPHNNLGNVYFRLGWLKQAQAEYEAAIRIKPEYAEARNNLGAVLATAGQTQAAIQQFKQALSIDPDYQQARTNLNLAEQQTTR
jgi:tetratricopeptide (TPR) repeat protein